MSKSKYRPTYLLRRLFIFLLTVTLILESRGETRALSDDPDFIKASILITSPGDFPHQIVGHASIRMECPPHNLDRVFSFNNATAEDFKKLLVEKNVGGMQEIYSDIFFDEIREEHRQLTSFTLNLTLQEKARLWEVLDSLKALPLRPFSITDSHCGSMMAHALDIAVFPSRIDWDEPPLQGRNYGYLARLSENGNYPWSYLLLSSALGNMMDTKETGRYYVSPTIFEKEFNKFKIYDTNHNTRPLITGSSEILVKETGDHSANRPTPIEASLIILVIVIIITVFQCYDKWLILGKILDGILWGVVIIGGLLGSYLTFGPVQYGKGWNWALILLNPLAWIPIVIFRRNPKILSWIWLTYAFILVLFSAFIGLISPSLDNCWRLLAFAIAIRCFIKVNFIKKF